MSDRQTRWMRSVTTGLASRFEYAEAQRDVDRIELINIVDRHSLDDVQRWLRAIEFSRLPPVGDPRRV